MIVLAASASGCAPFAPNGEKNARTAVRSGENTRHAVQKDFQRHTSCSESAAMADGKGLIQPRINKALSSAQERVL